MFFIDKPRTELLQIQKDRFLQPTGGRLAMGTTIPGSRQCSKLSRRVLGCSQRQSQRKASDPPFRISASASISTRCPSLKVGTLSDLSDDLFGQHTGSLALADLGKPEDLRFLLRYIMHDEKRKPVGRLDCFRRTRIEEPDGQVIMQLTLTARGRPSSPDEEGIISFLNRGRISVVRGFAHLTGPKMHKLWERKK